MNESANLRSWPAEDLLILARAAGMLWHSTGRADPYDVLSDHQRKLLDRASVSYLVAEQGGLDAARYDLQATRPPQPGTRQHKAHPRYGTVFDREDNPVPRGCSEDMFPLYGRCVTCGESARCLDITADWGHDSEFPDRYRYSHPVTPAERRLIRQARAWIADSFSDVDVADLDDGDVEGGVAAHYDGGWAAFTATELNVPAAFPAMAYVHDAAGDLADAILVYSAEQWTGLAMRQPAGFEVRDS